MGRKVLMVVLALGAVGGFAAGFARLCHGGYGHWGHGPGGREGRRAEFERHIADTCTEAAKRVIERQNAASAKP
jgi:hypothetical protein